jgi:hypothetical protein
MAIRPYIWYTPTVNPEDPSLPEKTGSPNALLASLLLALLN